VTPAERTKALEAALDTVCQEAAADGAAGRAQPSTAALYARDLLLRDVEKAITEAERDALGATVRRLEVRPGDVVFIESEMRLPIEVVARFRQQWQESMGPGARAVILDGAHLSAVISPAREQAEGVGEG
jgi:hypothetical protein